MQMYKNELISIIVPVHNTEDYLNRCIKSLVSQTYGHIEIILVNDGSSDNSKGICAKWVAQDNRIRLVDKECGGLVSARKKGLSFAQGEFVGFVDSDDYIETMMYEVLLRELQGSVVDFVYGNRIREDENGKEIDDASGYLEGEIELGIESNKGVKFLNDFVFRENHGHCMHKGGIVFGLYRADLITKVYNAIPDDCSQGEDMICLIRLALESKRMLVIGSKLYHYVERSSSMTHKVSVLKYIEDCRMVEHIIQICQKYNVYESLKNSIECYLNEKMILDVDRINPQLNSLIYKYPYEEQLYGKRVVLYAAGKVGRNYYQQFLVNAHIDVCLWVDSDSDKLNNELVHSVSEIHNCNYDVIIIAHSSEIIAQQIKGILKEQKISEEKIVYNKPLKNW